MSNWVWVGIGVGLYLLLRAKKAPAVIIEKLPPPWSPEECAPITPSMQPYIYKIVKAAEAVYGAGSVGEICVQVVQIPGLTLDESTSVVLQIYVSPGVQTDISIGMDAIKAKSHQWLVSVIRDQG